MDLLVLLCPSRKTHVVLHYKTHVVLHYLRQNGSVAIVLKTSSLGYAVLTETPLVLQTFRTLGIVAGIVLKPYCSAVAVAVAGTHANVARN